MFAPSSSLLALDDGEQRDAVGAEEVDEGVVLAIEAGISAGVFRRAERLNPGSAETWGRLAAPHSQRAATLLAESMKRLGVGSARPSSRLK
jgi:hypothetical protein